MPTDLSSEEDYRKWIKADEMARCYILASMSSVLQHQHQAMVTASDMMLNLKELFGHQDRAARQVAMKKLMTTTMAEGTPVRDHVLKMIGHLNEIEILGGEMDADTQCDIILQSLPKSFEQFRLNYNMNKLNLTLAGLLTELVSAEGKLGQSEEAEKLLRQPKRLYDPETSGWTQEMIPGLHEAITTYCDKRCSSKLEGTISP
ncbi:uncharacterized protein LOC141846458 [Curcuma longa]|uniref:uncharacterized protein LOC141846458 n=1 Tax=Curcuma longa TaxID=136217 RepID=UPI003D9E68D4